MMQHLERLLGFNLLVRLSQTLADRANLLYRFINSKASSAKPLGRELSAVNTNSPTTLVPLLMVFFGEEKELLFLPIHVN